MNAEAHLLWPERFTPIEVTAMREEFKMASEGRTYLKVKICTLAAEARIIRTEERRSKANKTHPLTNALADHRRTVVRSEARSALLAYGYLRGVPYKAIESSSRTKPDWRRVQAIACRFALGRYASGAKQDDLRKAIDVWRKV